MKQVPMTEAELIAEIERLEADLRSIIQHRPASEREEDRRAHDRQVEEMDAQIRFLKGQLEPS